MNTELEKLDSSVTSAIAAYDGEAGLMMLWPNWCGFPLASDGGWSHLQLLTAFPPRLLGRYLIHGTLRKTCERQGEGW